MKIISKRKDYWEYMLTQYGKDDKNHYIPTWKREEDGISSLAVKVKFKVNGRWSYYNETVSFSFMLKGNEKCKFVFSRVIVAGKGIPLIYAISKGKGYYFYTLESLKKFSNSLDIVNKDIIPRNIQYKYDYNLENFIKVAEEYFNTPAKGSEYVTAGPILFHSEFEGYRVSYRKNILLQDVEFFKSCIPIEKVFQDIETYVNYHFSTEHKIEVLDNATVAMKHGFDCKSFKHRKGNETCKFKT